MRQQLDKLMNKLKQTKKEYKRTKFLQKHKPRQVYIDLQEDSDQLQIISKPKKIIHQNQKKIQTDQKQQKKQPVQTKSIKYNNFNLEKLIKLKNPLPQKLQNAIQIVVTQQTLGLQQKSKCPTYYFKLQGSEKQKIVAENFLKQRSIQALKKFITYENNNKQKMAESSIKNESKNLLPIQLSQEQQKQKQSSTKPEPKLFRYFDIPEDNQEQNKNQKYCYRCGKKGHVARVCLQEAKKQRCIKCLSREHASRQCPQICFKCGQFGHHRQVCNAKQKCSKCRHFGHEADYCGVIGVPQSDYKIGYGQAKKSSDIKKLKCINQCKKNPKDQGHHNCFNYDVKKILQKKQQLQYKRKQKEFYHSQQKNNYSNKNNNRSNLHTNNRQSSNSRQKYYNFGQRNNFNNFRQQNNSRINNDYNHNNSNRKRSNQKYNFSKGYQKRYTGAY